MILIMTHPLPDAAQPASVLVVGQRQMPAEHRVGGPLTAPVLVLGSLRLILGGSGLVVGQRRMPAERGAGELSTAPVLVLGSLRLIRGISEMPAPSPTSVESRIPEHISAPVPVASALQLFRLDTGMPASLRQTTAVRQILELSAVVVPAMR